MNAIKIRQAWLKLTLVPYVTRRIIELMDLYPEKWEVGWGLGFPVLEFQSRVRVELAKRAHLDMPAKIMFSSRDTRLLHEAHQ